MSKILAHSDGNGRVPTLRRAQPYQPANNQEELLGSQTGFLTQTFRLLFAGLRILVQVMLVAWATLAIYYSNLPWPWLRFMLAGAFAAFAIFAFFLSRRRWMSPAAIASCLGVVAWWIAIPPSHDRPWRPEVAVMPRAVIEGDHIRITGVRNFEYQSRNEFTVRYEERELQLSHLTGLDFYVSYWAKGRSHTHS